jgi:hypothetical protein
MDDIEPIAGYINKRAMLEALYVQEGLPIKTIASRIGLGPATVERWMRLLDIPRRTRGGANDPARKGWRIHRLDPRLVLALSISKLSKLTGISESYIFKTKRGWMWTSA